MSTQTDTLKGAYTLAEEVNWEAAYKEYLPRVYNFFCYRVSDEALAEDLTAATFEKAWRGRSRFRRDLSAFSTWLFTIARNVAADHFRRRGPDVPLEAVREHADPASLEETVQRDQDFAQLYAILSQLPARERELIAFKYGAGLNNREIARLTRLSESNVGTILNRTVEKLRMQMEVDHER
ncbi:MAG TPA: sigma-70 family RNA polymerase sigma factor [Anaerolineales bacterium]|nr:sigma-70 family RNA polymerase sigma factor [Anaerolineales bacterium]